MPSVEHSANTNGPAPPLLAGRYAVTHLLGKGAQAKVYLGWDNRLKQWRALKVLAAAHLGDEHVRSRFDGEAQIMARLSHLHVMRVLDVAHDGRVPFLVMELSRGGSLVDWMKRHGAVPPRMAVEVAIQCTKALAHSHAQGIVHRDVKPHNILVQEEGRVVLTDFGIARADDSLQLTADGQAMGTFVFMAPEQRTDAHHVDHRADIYALGSSLFTMLTVRTSAELFIAEEKDKLMKGVPDPIRAVIVKACRYERDERYATMEELRLALERVLAVLPPDPPGPPLFEPLIAIPPRVPETLPPDAGVDELLELLAPAAPRASTSAPPPTARSGAPGSTTGSWSVPPMAGPSKRKTNPEMDEAPTPRPYVMPDLREARKRMNSLPPVGEDEEVPDYIDQSTLASTAPQMVREAEPVVIGSEGATPAPAKQAENPESKKRKKKRDGAKSEPPPDPASQIPWIRIGLVGAMFVVVILVGGTMAFSYSTKAHASAVRRDAGAAVVNQVLQLQNLVDELANEGADREKLAEAWFQFQDAKPQDRAETAIAFARLSVDEAGRVGARGKVGTQVHQLQSKLEAWESADEAWTDAKDSGLGRLTGSMGLF